MSDRFGSISISSEKPPSKPQKSEQPPPRRPSPAKKDKESHRGVVIFSLVTALLVALYFLAGIYLAPALAKKYLPGYFHKKAGLEVDFQTIAINPLNFQITVKQIQVRHPESSGPKPLLQTESLFMDLDLTSLLRNGLVSDSLRITGLELNLIRFADKSYNIPALFQLSAEQQEGEIMNFATLPFLFSLNNIDISESRILFTDKLTEKSHTIEQLHLAVPSFSNFSFQSQNYIQPYFSAIINGSPIQLRGETVELSKEQGFQTKLSCTIESLDLVPYFSYFPSSFPLTLSEGRADTDLEIYFSPQKKQGSRLRIDIKMAASDIAMQSKENDLNMATPAVKMEGSLEPFSKRLHIKNLILKEPLINTRKGELAANLQHLFPQDKANSSTTPQLAIDLALADGGKLFFLADKKTASRNPAWKSLQLSIKNFKTPGWNTQQETASGSFRLSGEMVTEKGSFTWQGNIKGTENIQGQLMLNTFPAAPLLDLIRPQEDEKVIGNATVSSTLTIAPKQGGVANYSLTNGTLQFHHLKLSQKKKQWLQAESVRFSGLSRTDGRFNLGNIFLEDATLSLNSQNLPSLGKRLITQTDPLQLEGIDFSGTLNIKAKAKSAPALQLTNVTVQANNLKASSSKEKATSAENFAFTANLPSQGVIKSKGHLTLGPLKLTTSLAFSNIDTSLLSPFLHNWQLLHSSKSTLHGKGTYQFPKPSFTGSLRVTDADLKSSQKNSLLSWKQAEFDTVDCRFSPFQLQAKTVLIDSPHLQWQQRAEKTSPFQQIQKGLKTLLQTSDNKKTKKKQLLPTTIQEIRFQNGSLTYQDQRLSPPWKPAVEKLNGSLKNLNTSGTDTSPFTLSGTIDKAPFTLSGSLTLFSAAPSGRSTLQLTDFPLVSIKKQLASLPINPEDAKLNLLYESAEEPSFLNNSAKMVISDLVPSSAESDTALTLALLKDKKGSFPLTIHMKENSKSLLQESANNFQTTVIKASYAPLLLDPNFSDLQENNFVAFQPGSNKLAPTAQKILTRYAELLETHPTLALAISGLADRENDQRVLLNNLEEKEQQRVERENARRKAEYMEKQSVGQEQPPADTLQEEDIAKDDLAGYIPLLPNPVSVADETLLLLARERALIIHNFFTRLLTHDFFARSLAAPSERILIEGEGKIIEKGVGNQVLFTLKAMPLAQK